jgi:hypothetical protein
MASMRSDIRVWMYRDPVSTQPFNEVDTFVERIEPQPLGGSDGISGATCVTFPAMMLADVYTGPRGAIGTDGIPDTITSSTRGPVYCFDVKPKQNATVARTAAFQVFKVFVRVEARAPSGVWQPLGADRPVVFIVPPAP